MVTAATMQERASRFCDNRQCEEAVALLEEILEGFPRHPEVHNLLGICYSGACGGHVVIQPDIALEHFRLARECGPGAPGRLNRARVLSSKGTAYAGSRLLDRSAGLRAAVECHEAAASIYLEEGCSGEWAREQYLLGNLWCDMPVEACPDKWARAIAHYRGALQVRTRKADPLGWAAVLQNMGTAYRELRSGDPVTNLGRAINCYRLALRVCTRGEHPARYAALHNNIGNACLTLPAPDAAGTRRRVRLALRHFDVALSIRTREDMPADRAVTQFNRGNAFLRLAEMESVRPPALRQAEKCFRDAAACRRLAEGLEPAAVDDPSVAEQDADWESLI